MRPQPQPFRLQVPETELADLRSRLARTRFPDEPPLEAWSTGTSLHYLEQLVSYWAQSFDWRRHESELNAFRQYTVGLGGIELHFIHEPGRGPNPTPLLLSHGWPGSIVEFRRIIPLLTERFTVVAPSLPGYTLSFKPGQKRFAVEDIADLFAELMTGVLGYPRFAAQGGDWGAFVASVLGMKYPERLLGIHLNLLAVRRDPREPAQTPEEADYLGKLKHFLKEETGYQWIQGTRPQTLAYGLTDSPAGLAAWIAEKFRAWSDAEVSRDDLLANISLYWFTRAIGSSFWPYYARMHSPWPIPPGRTVDVPAGYAEFPREILRPPRSLAERTYTDLRRWTRMPRGGHFAALEQPQALAAEILAFFSELT
ncbi:MAG TPA: epoxide hydrolase [Burkholderiales bacterium]|nr:epoxide hydrolase [Burkholderiales bacterium]